MQQPDFEMLMSNVASGSEEAVWQLATIYSPHILRVVRRSLSPKLRSKIDSIDIVQTLWASILLRPADMTKFQTPQQLIAFLARATKNKVIDKALHFSAQKYDVSREVDIKDVLDHDEHQQLHSHDPTPSAVASVRERWQKVIASCSDQERTILSMRKDGGTYAEIGNHLSISCDKARRVIEHLVEIFVE
jgi:RNA polymerase sigma factor (sigma-70 family)